MASLPASPTRAPLKTVPIPRNGVDYRHKIVLAPMVRSGELPSRLLALQYGADLVWGPETIDRALIGTTRKTNPATGTIDFTRLPSHNNAKAAKRGEEAKESVIFRIHPEKERGRLVYQIGTAKPELAVQAARLVAGDVAGIDVNAGCPKAFSTGGGMGAALLKEPEKLCTILRALVSEIGEEFGIGISVKIRLLETREETRSLVERLVQTGITGLTVHCRTTPMRPRERAIREQLRMIGEICRQAGVACLMNGDVTSREEGVRLAEEFGVDGAMIATAAEANPSVFRTAERGGKVDWKEVSAEYMRVALQVENKWGNTKFTLGQLMMGKAESARKCQVAKSYSQAVEYMGLTEELGEIADMVDEKLGLKVRVANMEKSKGVEKAMKENKSAKAAGKHVPMPKRREQGTINPLTPGQMSVSSMPAMVSACSSL
ncbi:hypothetical protein MMC10_008789 [Thelotrema lepadinum]|nr:hypothetical protein [Thelotrema lepadinum]